MICPSCGKDFPVHEEIQPPGQKPDCYLEILIEIQREEEIEKGNMAWMSRTWKLAEKGIQSCLAKTSNGATLEST